ncbi:MAG: Na+/H+ antiporter subunit D [Desulfobacteraceae bacterium]|nr:Na+/H+ antiporter subunit D [Desulfobacteraceae bacterium]
MNDNLLVLPILIPFLTGIVGLLAWKNIGLQRIISVIGSAALLLVSLILFSWVRVSGIQSTRMGSWPAPFGIILVCDLLSAILVILAGIVGLAVMVYSMAAIDRKREAFGYYPLLNILLMGVCGAFLTGDLFNLYVWFEVMLMASFVLLELGGGKKQIEGAVKYVTLNLMSSALFLTGIALLYGITGSLNMAEISLFLKSGPSSGLIQAVSMLFFLAFGIKAAVFPLFFWLPESYHTPPAPVSAIFAGLLTKVGVYAMIRAFTLIFVKELEQTQTMVLSCAGLTMVAGALGAVSKMEFRRILSFNLVSHVGYMVMGLGLYTLLSITGAIFYFMHHMITITNLFLISGLVRLMKGSYELKPLGGIYRDFPLFSFLFLISALALAGVPPLSGFWAKLILIKAGILEARYAMVGAALLVSLLTLYSMVIIWNEAFWKDPPGTGHLQHGEPMMIQNREVVIMMLPIILLSGLNIFIGIFPEGFFNCFQAAAEQLMNPSEYVRVVLGRGGL